MSLNLHSCRHGVLFYRDEASLRDNVVPRIASALRAGEPVLVIASAKLRQQIAIEMHREHVHGTPFGSQRGALVAADAVRTLERFCKRGKPDAAQFRKIVGGLLTELAAAGKPPTVYGEMVGVLCERGQHADAVRLELMWNELLASSQASLLCGYHSALFDHPDAQPFYDAICEAHEFTHDPEREPRRLHAVS